MTDHQSYTMKQARAELAAMDYSLRRTGHSDELRIAPRNGTSEQREACAYYTNDLRDAVATARFERDRALLQNGALDCAMQRATGEAFAGRDGATDRQFPGERLVGRLADATHDDERGR